MCSDDLGRSSTLSGLPGEDRVGDGWDFGHRFSTGFTRGY